METYYNYPFGLWICIITLLICVIVGLQYVWNKLNDDL